MISIRPVIRNGKMNKQGLYNIYLEINKRGKRDYFSLDKFIKKEDWDSEQGLVKKSYPTSKRLNAYINKQIEITEENIERLEKKSQPVEASKLKKALKSSEELDFIAFAEETLKRSEKTLKIGSFRGHTAILNKFKEYMKNKPLPIEDINVRFIKEYEAYLLDELNNSINTVHNNLKVIRKYILEAVRQDILPYDRNPFLRFKLKRSQTNKTFLNEDELKRMEDLVLSFSSMMNHHRNIYVVCCYIGLRISDVLKLKWKHIEDEMLYIRIHKTEDPLNIKLPKKVIDILNQYRPEVSKPNSFIFPLLKDHLDYSNDEVLFNALSSASAYVNKDLRKIAKKARINKHLSFHTSRVTFATRALRKGINLSVVSKLLGHKSITTTSVYTKIIDKDMIEAMAVFD